jgi:hypothetical protein
LFVNEDKYNIILALLYAKTLKMEATFSLETSVTVYEGARSHRPVGSNPNNCQRANTGLYNHEPYLRLHSTDFTSLRALLLHLPTSPLYRDRRNILVTGRGSPYGSETSKLPQKVQRL